MTYHRHDFATPGIGHNSPCPICGGRDRLEVVEKLAADLWESRRTGHVDDRPWADAGPHWQHIFRGFAETALESLGG